MTFQSTARYNSRLSSGTYIRSICAYINSQYPYLFGGIFERKIKFFILLFIKHVLSRNVTEDGTSIVFTVAFKKHPFDTALQCPGMIIAPDTFTPSKALEPNITSSKKPNSLNDVNVLFANIVPMGLKRCSNVVLIPSGLCLQIKISYH